MRARVVPPLLAVLAALLALQAPASAQGQIRVPPEVRKLYDDYPVIELVTMGIGGLIWERHGHIGLCVRYADPSKDACYNYGIGDFHHPLGMATGFFRGTNSFWVGKMEPDQMLSVYRWADRTIWVQPLPLNADQKKQVIDKLEDDILDEHRYYAYDHFWDNCTTRVRDIIDHATGGALSSMTETTDGLTYRDLARYGFFGMRIPLLITDLAMGRVTDRVPSYWERMFLPDYLREAVKAKWHIEPIPIYMRRECRSNPDPGCALHGAPVVPDPPSGRVLFALFTLLMTASAWATRRWGRFERAGLGFAVVPYVFLGSVFLFLAVISPLPYVRWNESILLFLPSDILLVWFLSAERRIKYARARVVMIGLMALLLLIGLLKQPLWEALLWPLVPNAVVGFWPARWTRAKAAAADVTPAKAKAKRGKR